MLFKCVLLTLGGKKRRLGRCTQLGYCTAGSMMASFQYSQVVRRKRKRGAYTNQHEASLGMYASGRRLYSQPFKRPWSPPCKILTLCTRALAGVDARTAAVVVLGEEVVGLVARDRLTHNPKKYRNTKYYLIINARNTVTRVP